MAAKGMSEADLMRATDIRKSLLNAYVHGRVDQPREPIPTRLANVLGV